MRRLTRNGKKRTGESVLCDDGIRRDKPYDKMSSSELKRCKRRWLETQELAKFRIDRVGETLIRKIEQEARQLQLPFENTYEPELEYAESMAGK
jgi:hypothetical protein